MVSNLTLFEQSVKYYGLFLYIKNLLHVCSLQMQFSESLYLLQYKRKGMNAFVSGQSNN